MDHSKCIPTSQGKPSRRRSEPKYPLRWNQLGLCQVQVSSAMEPVRLVSGSQGDYDTFGVAAMYRMKTVVTVLKFELDIYTI